MAARLLVVDDDEFLLSLITRVLAQCGYAVDSAADGLAAWAMLDSEPRRFDLVLLDKQMPRMDGISLLKRVKSDPRFTDLPVIMLTGDNRQQDIIEGLAEGAYYYLTKPSTQDVLQLVIKNALNDFRQKRELRELIGRQANNLNLLRRAEFCYRTLAEARELALLLAEASLDPARTVSGYSELLINAVEHGNLGISYAEKSLLLSEGRWAKAVAARQQDPFYAERLVTVTLEKTPNASCVTIADQGAGFDWQAYVEFSPERAFDLHGRGIAMSKALSFDHLEYLANGSSVITTVRRPPPTSA
jgi:CheY-like chemotaxis protein